MEETVPCKCPIGEHGQSSHNHRQCCRLSESCFLQFFRNFGQRFHKNSGNESNKQVSSLNVEDVTGSCETHPRKRALLCGVTYQRWKYRLKGTIYDVRSMRDLLIRKYDYDKACIRVLTGNYSWFSTCLRHKDTTYLYGTWTSVVLFILTYLHIFILLEFAFSIWNLEQTILYKALCLLVFPVAESKGGNCSLSPIKNSSCPHQVFPLFTFINLFCLSYINTIVFKKKKNRFTYHFGSQPITFMSKWSSTFHRCVKIVFVVKL